MKKSNPYPQDLQMWRWLIGVGILNSALYLTSAPDALRVIVSMFVPVDLYILFGFITIFSNNILSSIIVILLLSVIILYFDKLTYRIGVRKPLPKILLNLFFLLITTLLIELLTIGYWMAYDNLLFIINTWIL
jgi:hypothetical protein